MAHLSKSEIIKSNPIGEGLNAFRISFISASPDIPELSDAVEHMHIGDEGEVDRPDVRFFLTYIGLKNLVLDLVLELQNLPAARVLPPNGRGILLGNLSRFISLVVSNDFDVKSVIPLLNKVVSKAPDADIWGAVYGLITESTPSPRQLPYLDQTPVSFNTGSFANTSLSTESSLMAH